MTDSLIAASDDTPPTDGQLMDKRKKLLRLFALALLALAVIWGIWYFVTQAGRVSTDNAYVGADTAVVTPLISGPVKDVRVGGTQMVNKGDILVILDDADVRVDLANAEAMLQQAQQQFRQTKATGTSLDARLAARAADAMAAQWPRQGGCDQGT
jgi:membrane fusion protein (multidrug efflux system)